MTFVKSVSWCLFWKFTLQYVCGHDFINSSFKTIQYIVGTELVNIEYFMCVSVCCCWPMYFAVNNVLHNDMDNTYVASFSDIVVQQIFLAKIDWHPI